MKLKLPTWLRNPPKKHKCYLRLVAWTPRTSMGHYVWVCTECGDQYYWVKKDFREAALAKHPL